MIEGSLNSLPAPWVLDLTQDELDLYRNLVPDDETGLPKAEFRLLRQVDIEYVDLTQLKAFFADTNTGLYDDFTIVCDGDTHFIEITGTGPMLNDDERDMYDSIMVKVRKEHHKVLLERLEMHKKMIGKIEEILNEFVWE